MGQTDRSDRQVSQLGKWTDRSDRPKLYSQSGPTGKQTDRSDRYLVVVSISEGQSEVVFLQQVDVITNLLKQLQASSSFLHRTENNRFHDVM